MEMSSKAFQYSDSEIMIRPIDGSSYSSAAKYLPCVSYRHHHGNNLAVLFNRLNSFLKADRNHFQLQLSYYWIQHISDYPSNTCFLTCMRNINSECDAS